MVKESEIAVTMQVVESGFTGVTTFWDCHETSQLFCCVASPDLTLR